MNLSQTVSAAKAQGYTHVLTAGGQVSLDDWTPYGKREGHHIEFELNESGKVHEIADTAQAFCTGIWTLTHNRQMEILQTAASNVVKHLQSLADIEQAEYNKNQKPESMYAALQFQHMANYLAQAIKESNEPTA